jgi:hypothetical protein
LFDTMTRFMETLLSKDFTYCIKYLTLHICFLFIVLSKPVKSVVSNVIISKVALNMW